MHWLLTAYLVAIAGIGGLIVGALLALRPWRRGHPMSFVPPPDPADAWKRGPAGLAPAAEGLGPRYVWKKHSPVRPWEPLDPALARALREMEAERRDDPGLRESL